MSNNNYIDLNAILPAQVEAPASGVIRLADISGTLKQVNPDGTSSTIGGGGVGTGTVTSVAPTAGGLLAVAGTPTVAPTVGIGAIAGNTVIGNNTSGSAVPTALTTIPTATMPAFTGDVTTTTGTVATVIANGAITTAKIADGTITLTKIANQADVTILGNNSGGVGPPIALNASQARTVLGLGSLATQSGTFSGTSSGTNTGDQTITVTGDVTGSGTGSFVTTIANNAVTTVKITDNNVTLAKIATQANLTILGNGSGGSAVPAALTISAATGLIADATTLKNTLTQGVAGGQTVIGGTLTTQNITLRPNAADTTTGTVINLGNQFQVGAVTPPYATTPWLFRAAATNQNQALVIVNPSSGTTAQAGFLLANADALNTGSGGMTINSTGFTTVGNSTAGSIVIEVAGSAGTANLIYRVTQAAGAHIWETTTSKTERMRLTNAGSLTIGTGLTTTATDGFLYVNSCAGPPTGVPTSLNSGNSIPLTVDRTNNKAYIYSGGAWVALN